MAMRLEYAVLPEPHSGRLQPLRLPLLLAVAAAALCAGGYALAGQQAAVRHFTTPAAKPTLSSAVVPVVREAGAAGSRVPTVGANGDVAAEIYATPGPATAALRPAALPLALLALITMPAAALGAVLLARLRAAAPRPAALVSGGTAGPVARHRAVRRPSTALRAATTDGTGAVYQVQLGKPLDVTLVRGLDGGTYVLHVATGPRQGLVTPGDRVTRCGDPFSAEMWDAITYGSVMYAIRAARGGNIILELEQRGGDMSPLRPILGSQPVVHGATEELEASEADLRAEEEKRELEIKRAALWRQAVLQVELKQYQVALVLFEEVIGMEFNIVRGVEPKSELLRISYYLMACVYSLLGDVETSLESLKLALINGYNDRRQIFSDPALARTRETEGFRQLMAVFRPPEAGLADEGMEEWEYDGLFEDEDSNFPDQTYI